MTSADMRDLVAKAGDVLGAWGTSLETSRELYAVRLDGDGALLEYAVWDGSALAAGNLFCCIDTNGKQVCGDLLPQACYGK